MKSKKKTQTKKPAQKRITQLPEKPLHLPMSFEEAIKMAVNTPIKNSKIKKK